METKSPSHKSIKSKKRKKSDDTDPLSPNIMHPAKGSRKSQEQEQPSTAPKVAKLASTTASSSDDDLAGVIPIRTDQLLINDHDLGGLLDNVDFDSDAFDFQSQDGDSAFPGSSELPGSRSNSIPSSVPSSIPDVDHLLSDDIFFDEGFAGEVDEASKFTVRMLLPISVSVSHVYEFSRSQLDLKSWRRCIVVKAEREQSSFDIVMTVREDVANGAHAKCRLQGPWYLYC